MAAAADIFSRKCLLQFEDFNTNDAFPLLEARFCTEESPRAAPLHSSFLNFLASVQKVVT